MENHNKNHIPTGNVHKVLAHSYSAYFVFFLTSVCLDLFLNYKISSNFFMRPVGILLLIFGTLIVFWAQKTSRHLEKENITKKTFFHGPYKYTRGPTHLGLFFLMLGFGITINALFVILFAFVSYFFLKYTFLNKQEKILEAKYGTPYREYKKAVKF